ncbi:MAG: hypothetical protein AAGU74_00105 [Bacillota bacterium]
MDEEEMEIGYLGLPIADLLGNAGLNGPADREIRYTQYMERLLQRREG